jgi:hypothetical protein
VARKATNGTRNSVPERRCETAANTRVRLHVPNLIACAGLLMRARGMNAALATQGGRYLSRDFPCRHVRGHELWRDGRCRRPCGYLAVHARARLRSDLTIRGGRRTRRRHRRLGGSQDALGVRARQRGACLDAHPVARRHELVRWLRWRSGGRRMDVAPAACLSHRGAVSGGPTSPFWLCIWPALAQSASLSNSYASMSACWVASAWHIWPRSRSAQSGSASCSPSAHACLRRGPDYVPAYRFGHLSAIADLEQVHEQRLLPPPTYAGPSSAPCTITRSDVSDSS